MAKSDEGSTVSSLLVLFAVLLSSCVTRGELDGEERRCVVGERWAEADYAGDCRKLYFLCQNGIVVRYQCNRCQQFDPKRGHCVKGFKSSCISPTMEKNCNNSHARTMPDPYECVTTYSDCYGGMLKRLTCQKGSQFDDGTATCLEGVMRSCHFPDEARDCFKGATWAVPNHNDCNRMFYRCDDGVFTSWVCKEGAQYSPVERKCVQGYVSECHRALEATDHEKCGEDEQWIKPDPFYCAYRFYKCTNGLVSTVSCIEGFQVNINNGSCVKGYTSDCRRASPEEINLAYLNPSSWSGLQKKD